MTEPSAEPLGEARPPFSRKWVDLDGPVHYIDYGGPADAPVLLLVHGLGGSVLNWAAAGPPLAQSCRVLAVDLVGFGRTRSVGTSPTIDGNRRLLERFVDTVVGHPVVLVGNSMGGLLSLLVADARPDIVAGLVLVDPALPVGITAPPDPLVGLIFTGYAIPAVGNVVMARRRSFMSAEAQAKAILRLSSVDSHRIPSELWREHLALARERDESCPDADAELVVAARSLLFVLAHRRRIDELTRRMVVPVLLLHGAQDRLVPLAAARRVAALNPLWRFEVAENVGHMPQLEAPDWAVGHILDWLATEGDIAARTARA
ncbi:MAG: alpha/beta hydrolase [Intrasporangium sp.]|uniref:alpha/beta fold hydrolase n=1 Tax=Intrasporangium sp. TaxID=1925024 RepID=UPI00264A4632|nr:alpha/beta hydrolase [Intrasporangium sp.]MDN5796585.1 alpha/beta hydrolase [Intrasporangium sp.]